MHWYQRLFRRARDERQLDAELRFHLDQQVANYVASGMTPAEARRRARLEFGGLEQVKEQCRDVGAARFVETLLQDLRYGLRQLRSNPGVSAAAILALALGPIIKVYLSCKRVLTFASTLSLSITPTYFAAMRPDLSIIKLAGNAFVPYRFTITEFPIRTG